MEARDFASAYTVAPVFPGPLAHFQCAFRLFCYPGVPHVARDMRRHPGLWNDVPCGTKRAQGCGGISWGDERGNGEAWGREGLRST
jgi:hypothetical protein